MDLSLGDYLIPICLVISLGLGAFIYWKTSKLDKQKLAFSPWIKISILISTASSDLNQVKLSAKSYADKLGWVVKTDSQLILPTVAEIIICPPNGSISPSDYVLQKEQIHSVSFAIMRDLCFAGNDSNARNNMFTKTAVKLSANASASSKPHKNEFYIFQSVGVLELDYPILNRFQLESVDLVLAKEVFDNRLRDDLHKIFNKPHHGKQNGFGINQNMNNAIVLKRKLEQAFGVSF